MIDKKIINIRKSQLTIYTSLVLLVAIMTTSIYSESFDINEFSDPFKYGWNDEESRLNARDDLFLKTMTLNEYESRKQSPFTNALKTSFAPGWGHFSVGSYTKGQIFLGTQLVLFGTSMYYREKAMIEYRKYENASQIDDIVHYYDEAIVPYRQSNLLFSLFVIAWGYTIYDVVVDTNNYNWALWDELVEKSSNSRLQITPTSISYSF